MPAHRPSVRSALRIAALLLPLVPSSPLGAQNADPLLTMSPGARVAGLGHAAVALPGEPEAVSTNPAALLAPEGWVQVARVASGSLADVSGNAIAAGAPLAGGAVGVALAYDDYGDLVRTGEAPGDVLGESSLHDLSLALSYARPLAAGLAAGVTGRFVRSDRGIGTASGGALDAGVLLRLAGGPVSLGASLVNLGGDLAYDLEDAAPQQADGTEFRIALPRRLRVGASVSALRLPARDPELRLTAGYDLVAGLEDGEGWNHHAGAELSIGSVLALRAGILSQTNPFAAGSGREWGTTAGIGVSSGGWVLGVAREMGLSSLGDATHLSAGYRF